MLNFCLSLKTYAIGHTFGCSADQSVICPETVLGGEPAVCLKVGFRDSLCAEVDKSRYQDRFCPNLSACVEPCREILRLLHRWRTGRFWSDHKSGRCIIANSVVQRGNRTDAPSKPVLAQGVGITGRQASGAETRHRGGRTTHRSRAAPHVGGWHGVPHEVVLKRSPR